MPIENPQHPHPQGVPATYAKPINDTQSPTKISPELRQAILKRTTELQNRIPKAEQTPSRVLPLYLEAATQIVEELPGKVNPLLPAEKILLFLIDIQK